MPSGKSGGIFARRALANVTIYHKIGEINVSAGCFPSFRCNQNAENSQLGDKKPLVNLPGLYYNEELNQNRL